MKNNYKNQLRSLILICLLSWISNAALQAQNTTINGPSTANVNDVDNYTVNVNTNDLFYYEWFATGGTTSSEQDDSVVVTWTTAGSNNMVTYDGEGDFNYYYGEKIVNVTSPPPPTPTPALSSVTQPDCNTATGSFTITNYNASHTYTANPSLGVIFSGATVTAPQGSYTITAASGGVSSNPSSNVIVNAQPNCGTSNDENYIHTIVPRAAVSSETGLDNLVDEDKIESITYFDGLGRPKQQIGLRAGGAEEDIITHIEYDAIGRQEKEWLPYAVASNNGGYIATAKSDTQTFYDARFLNEWNSGNEINAYAQKHIEASPLNRILEQGAPGKKGKVDKQSDLDETIKMEYATNVAGEVVKFDIIYPTGDRQKPELYYNGTYDANTLTKTITKTEHWHGLDLVNPRDRTSEEFKDNQGRVLLKRVHGVSELNVVPHDTYYVYDDFGNLTYVLSPKGTDLAIFQNTYTTSNVSGNYSELIANDGLGNPIVSGSGNVSVDVNATNKTLTVNFSVAFNAPVSLLSGPTVKLQNDVPNIMIGTIPSSTNEGYIVSIQEGYLNVSGTGTVTTLNQNFVLNLEDFSIDNNIIDDLGYQYIYDKQNRLIEKKISGKGWEHIVYDKLDRPVLRQDALMRGTDHWLFTKYDAFDRVVYTGKMLILGEDRASIQSYIDAETVFNENATTSANYIQGWSIYYTNSALSLSSIAANITELHTINYYDTYNSDLTTAFANPGSVFLANVGTNTKSLVTGSKVYVLDKSEWITTVNYYDDKGRLIYAGSKNDYLDTSDIVKYDLDDFTGEVLKTEAIHTKGNNSSIVVTDNFTYDHSGRSKMHTQTITGQTTELIAENNYDNLGQLVTKNVGGATSLPNSLQTLNYTYTIRGWLESINDHTSLGTDLWGFELSYSADGNILSQDWKTKSINTSGFPVSEGYNYAYNSMGRIIKAWDKGGYYDLNRTKYDKNGNVLALYREGAFRYRSGTLEKKFIDLLGYTYKPNSNQLLSVHDGAIALENPNNPTVGYNNAGFINGNTSGDDYAYDVNGNMTQDLNKNLTNITYNHLNLPKQHTFTSGNIMYVYDALGTKLEKKVTEGSSVTTTRYANGYVYKEDNAGEVLEFFNHPEGYVDASGSGYEYVYQYKDHLGNVRLSYSDTDGDGQIAAATEILEENNYYPFGLKHKGYNSSITGRDHQYGFGNREEIDELGLGVLDFGERNYQPELGRWFNIDPFAEFMRNQSPYNFGFNNPIYFSDYGGTIPWPVPEMFRNWIRKLGSLFGPRNGRNHNGIDINFSGGYNTDYGAPIVATHSGTVVRINSTNEGRAGRYIEIESPDGSFMTRYLHLSSIAVEEGQEISEGQTIGLLGGSGKGYDMKVDKKSPGYWAHLHYEIHRNGTPINPIGANGSLIDPQLWIKPHRNDFYDDFAYQDALYAYEYAEEDRRKGTGQSAQSEPESNNGGGRTPVIPLPSITPAPIVPIPTPLPGGTITPITPTPSPTPLPVVIPKPRPDHGN
jgi:RHS repeat-associated protein